MKLGKRIKNICVLCSPNPVQNPKLVQSARQLGSSLAKRSIGLVYGGSSVGLMNEVAEAALEANGKVFGVTTVKLAKRELAHTKLTELHTVNSQAERTQRVQRLSQGFIALPGGLGTLSQFTDKLTLHRRGLFPMPCGILNADGFYDDLFRFLARCTKENLVQEDTNKLLFTSSDPEELLNQLEEFYRLR